MPRHGRDDLVSARIGADLQFAGRLGFITNAQVQAAASVTDESANILAAAVHGRDELRRNFSSEAVLLGKLIGDYTDAIVAASTGYDNQASNTAIGSDIRAIPY